MWRLWEKSNCVWRHYRLRKCKHSCRFEFYYCVVSYVRSIILEIYFICLEEPLCQSTNAEEKNAGVLYAEKVETNVLHKRNIKNAKTNIIINPIFIYFCNK